MGKKVLLTGGAGFIGSHIAEGLLKENFEVRIIDNFSTGSRNNLLSFINNVELIEGDIRDYPTVSRAVSGVNIIIHEAALPSVPRSINDPITTNEVNVKGTLNLLWAAVEKKVNKFVFASSSSIYGNSSELIKHEGLTPHPLSPYAVSKLAGENYCRVFSETYGFNTVCLRYFNVFGPRQNPNSQYSAVIPKFIGLMKKNERPTIFGDGLQSRDFTFVNNVVNANLLALKNTVEKNLIMNCACSVPVSLNEMVGELNQNLGKNLEPIYTEERPGDIKHSFADISLAKLKIGYEPEILFGDGLKKTIDEFNF